MISKMNREFTHTCAKTDFVNFSFEDTTHPLCTFEILYLFGVYYATPNFVNFSLFAQVHCCTLQYSTFYHM